MIWDLATIFKIRQLGAVITLDRSRLAADRTGVMKKTLVRAHGMLNEMANSYAVDLSILDIEMRQTEDIPTSNQVVIRAIWNPKVYYVEFHGGPKNGHAAKLHDSSLFRPMMTSKKPLSGSVVNFEVEEIETVMYCYAGWNETTRCWVYQAEE